MNKNNRLDDLNEKLKGWKPRLTTENIKEIAYKMPMDIAHLYKHLRGEAKKAVTAEGVLSYLEKNYNH